MKRICRMCGEEVHTALWNLRYCREEIVERALLLHGILDKPIYACENTGLYWAFKASANGDQLKELKLVQIAASQPWVPRNIKPSVWQKAVDEAGIGSESFVPSLSSIAKSVNSNLLKDIYSFVSFTKVVSLIDILLPDFMIGKTVRRRDDKEYYFDSDLVYRCRDAAASSWALDKYLVKRVDGRVWMKSAAYWEEGDTASKCIDAYLLSAINYEPTTYSFMERLCTKIDKPEFERSADFPKRDGYDRIRVTVCLNSSLFPTYSELLACVREHRKEIDKLVADRVRDATEQKLDSIPLSEFKLTGIHAARDYTIDYMFERTSPAIGARNRKPS